jgi:hypothetical protein
LPIGIGDLGAGAALPVGPCGGSGADEDSAARAAALTPAEANTE